MSKIYYFLLICFALTPAITSAALPIDVPTFDTGIKVNYVKESAHRINLEYELSDDAVKLWIEDGRIPAITRWIALPDDGDASLSVTDLQSEALHTTLDFQGGDNLLTSQDNAISLGAVSLMQNVRFVPVTFHPVSVDADGQAARLIRSASVSLELPQAQPPLFRLTRSARQVWGDLLLNNEPPARDENGEGAGYVYVVPNDRRVRDLMERLYEWRRQQGFDVQEIVVQAQFDGERVYQSLQNLNRWGTPIEYICLVGDTGGEFVVPTTLRGTSDYHYSLLSGDDPLPDAAVGRLSFNSLGELSRIISKIMDYEQNPDLNDLGWLRRGAVAAGSQISGFSTVLIGRYVRDELLDFGFSEVDTFWYNMEGGVENFMRRSFDSGMSFVNYRGWTGLEDWTPAEAIRLTNDKLPVALFLGCSTGDFDGIGAGYTEALLRAEGGAIGAIGCATLQSRVNYNNAMMAGFYKGVLDDGTCRLGWTLNRAKLELFATYGAFAEQWVISHAYWTNLMGDPGTVIWRGEPRRVTLEAPNPVFISDDPVQVRVHINNQPVAGVRVGLHKPNQQTVAVYTDENGNATFTIDSRRVTAGGGSFMVSGDRVLPVRQAIQFVPPQQALSFQNSFIRDNDQERHVGNGDGQIEPFETFDVYVSIRNIGNNLIQGPVNFTLTTNHNSLEILQPNFRLDQEIGGGGVVQANFLVRSRGSFPNDTPVPMTLTARANEAEWVMNFSLTGQAPNWTLVGIDPNIPIRPGADFAFSLGITNNGRLNAGETQGRLISDNIWVEDIIEEVGEFGQLFVGDTSWSGQVYSIAISFDAPFGAIIPFELRMTSDAGYSGTIPISFQIRDREDGHASGPDAYGYWAIDDRDDNSNLRPFFNWTELNRRLGGNGINTGLLDRTEDEDESTVLNLPFTFTYYGQEYNRLTVCTNGWAAFGEQSDYVDFRNMPIGSPQGPGAQICPWWDDLYQPTADAGVFYRYDADMHRFIVEWSRMHRWVGPAGPGAEESFQLILHDPEWYPTYTGDGDIIFQYLTVNIESRVDGYSTPYSTIGINNPEDNDGLQYAFWNEWSPGATPLRATSVIRFATAERHVYGTVSGTVNMLVNGLPGDPVPNAIVKASTGGWVIANELGVYEGLNVLAGLPFTLTAMAEGYNNTVSGELRVDPNGIINQAFVMPHPEIALDVESVRDTIDAGEDIEYFMTLANSGNGGLQFNIDFTAAEDEGEFRLDPMIQSRDDADELWENLFGLNVTGITNDDRILGAAYVEDGFWISGGASGEEVNYLYLFGRDGQLIRRVVQPCGGRWGMHDLAWDGEYLYGGCRDQIYKMNVRGQLVSSIRSPLIPPRGMAVNPDNGEIWVANDGNPFHRLDAEGNILGTYPHSLRPYGLAWHPAQADGYSLYIFSADGETNMVVSQLNPETGDIRYMTSIELNEGDRAGGCELSLEWDSRRWSLITIVQNNDGDRVEVFDAGPNLAWISVEPSSGEIAAGADVQITLNMISDHLDQGEYSVNMVITHNAVDGILNIPVFLVIEPQAAVVDEPAPVEYLLSAVYPNPSNGSGMIRFTLPGRSDVRLSVWDSSGRLIQEILNASMPAGQHSQSFVADNVPSGIYFVKLVVSNHVFMQKFALMK